MIAVIAGGTRGIGKATSLKFASQGYKVLALYSRNRKAAEDLEKEAKELSFDIRCIRGDLTNEKQFERLIEEIAEQTNSINTLVYSAASGVHRPLEKLSVKHLRWTIEINVIAFHKLVLSLSPFLNKGSQVIALTSAGGQFAIPNYGAVGCSKGALESLVRHYASEYASKGVIFNLVCPGLVETDAIEAFPDKDEKLKNSIENTPSTRLTTVVDVAEFTFSLTQPWAQNIVGQTLIIDGGKCIRV